MTLLTSLDKELNIDDRLIQKTVDAKIWARSSEPGIRSSSSSVADDRNQIQIHGGRGISYVQRIRIDSANKDLNSHYSFLADESYLMRSWTFAHHPHSGSVTSSPPLKGQGFLLHQFGLLNNYRFGTKVTKDWCGIHPLT